MRSRPVLLLTLLAVAYLATHLWSLAPALEDIDSINFGMGLRYFAPELHQPHPPGYPVYMAMGRVSLWVIEHVTALRGVEAEARALAVWSAIGGAACVMAAWFFFGALASRSRRDADRGAVWVATGLLAVAPLFWMSGLRPMSDMPGLALTMTAQALVLGGLGPRRLLLGALVGGVATGIRVQAAVLVMPVLLVALGEERRQGVWSTSLRALVAFGLGCLLWAIPLVIATGGIDAYLAALHSQAGEDFAWVDMLWSNPTPRHIAVALRQTFVLPWASASLAAVVGWLAAAGAVVMLVRERYALWVLLVSGVPYVLFHLAFQETITVRYALPAVPMVVWLAVRAMSLVPRVRPVLAVPLIVAAAIVAVPGGLAYGRDPHPAFRALADAARRAAVQPPAGLYSHYGVRRPIQAADLRGVPVVEPRLQYEWLGLVDYWLGGGTSPVWFFADPRRTDLALIDRISRRDVVRYRWSVETRGELSGTRPMGVDWYRLPVPGWFAGKGWSLTPETGGITQASATGPDHQPIDAWIRRRPGPFHVMIGTHYLGAAGDPDASVRVSVDGRVVDQFTISAAQLNVLHFVSIPEGLPGADRFAHLTIVASSLDPRRPAPVAIRQFDAQPATALMWGFGDGWYDDEYVMETGATWRWTSERSILRIDGPSRAVRVTLWGESPLRYFDAAPIIRMTAAGQTLGEVRPTDDFQWSVLVPADVLAKAGGVVAIDTNRVYLPGPAEGTADARHLGLRIFECSVESVDSPVIDTPIRAQ